MVCWPTLAPKGGRTTADAVTRVTGEVKGRTRGVGIIDVVGSTTPDIFCNVEKEDESSSSCLKSISP